MNERKCTQSLLRVKRVNLNHVSFIDDSLRNIFEKFPTENHDSVFPESLFPGSDFMNQNAYERF